MVDPLSQELKTIQAMDKRDILMGDKSPDGFAGENVTGIDSGIGTEFQRPTLLTPTTAQQYGNGSQKHNQSFHHV